MARNSTLYLGSIGLHLALGFGTGFIPKPTLRETVSVAVVESKHDKAKQDNKESKPEPPKPTVTPPAETRTRSLAHPKPQAAAPQAPQADQNPQAATGSESLAGFADIGLSLGGGTGSGGLAIPTGGGNRNPNAGTKAPPAKERNLVAHAANSLDCVDPLIKPKPATMVQPSYTETARQERIEGKVRVEVTVNISGRVTSARVLQGLGYGLDESAIAAAKQMTFEPATRCGKPIETSFVIAMRFVLGS